MRTFVHKTQPMQRKKNSRSTRLRPAFSGQSREVSSILHLQRTNGKQAVQRISENNSQDYAGDSIHSATPRGRHGDRRIPTGQWAEATTVSPPLYESRTPVEKAVDGQTAQRVGMIEENGPDGGAGPRDEGPPAVAAKKKAGVASFKVDWKKNANAGPTTAKLRLDYSAKFKKDATHDPALAEFRQNVMTKWEFTAGPHKGQKGDTSPMHDDNYSRADDTAGNTKNDVDFVSNDNPGFVAGSIDKDDVIDYSFTAEQMIIDTSDGNKVIAKRGPHTGTIKGKDPRAYGGVPKTLS